MTSKTDQRIRGTAPVKERFQFCPTCQGHGNFTVNGVTYRCADSKHRPAWEDAPRAVSKEDLEIQEGMQKSYYKWAAGEDATPRTPVATSSRGETATQDSAQHKAASEQDSPREVSFEPRTPLREALQAKLRECFKANPPGEFVGERQIIEAVLEALRAATPEPRTPLTPEREAQARKVAAWPNHHFDTVLSFSDLFSEIDRLRAALRAATPEPRDWQWCRHLSSGKISGIVSSSRPDYYVAVVREPRTEQAFLDISDEDANSLLPVSQSDATPGARTGQP